MVTQVTPKLPKLQHVEFGQPLKLWTSCATQMSILTLIWEVDSTPPRILANALEFWSESITEKVQQIWEKVQQIW